jgi:photosystem II stability/assembly factor-like uncharacterized protein
MRNRIWAIPALLCLLFTACNLPVRESSTPSAQTNAATGEAISPTVKPNDTASLPSSTNTPSSTLSPTPGPIPHLSAGTPAAIAYIDMIDAEEGWSIGGAANAPSQDHVLRTVDGGYDWRDVTPPEKTIPATDRIAVGAFRGTSNAWITYYSANFQLPPAPPVVWITSDGGATWQASAPLDLSGWVGAYRVSDLFFINPKTGWIMAHRGNDPASDRIILFQTTDGGGHWEKVADPDVHTDIQDCEKTGILFTGPWNGWLTGDCHGEKAGVFLFQTFDGGKSWIKAPLPNPDTTPGLFTSSDYACRLRPPILFNQQSMVMLAVECTSKTISKAPAYLYSLEGTSWHYMEYPGGQMVVRAAGDGRVFDGEIGSGLAVGQEIYMYMDQTQTWEKLDSIDWKGQFDFIDWNKGWAAARKGETPLLMHTADGGRTWQALEPILIIEG